jgi:class 3 adenylate cyclase
MNKDGFSIYNLIERIKPLKNIVMRGGIRFKWGIIISVLILIVVILLSTIYVAMSTNALLTANDKLCQTLAENIASTESIITGEKKLFKRSLILQDVLNELSQSKLEGLVYAAVYDIFKKKGRAGILGERKNSIVAHTKAAKKGKRISRKMLKELREVNEMVKSKIMLESDNSRVPSYQYRMPFKFFGSKVGVIEIVFTEESILGAVNRAKLYIILSGLLMLIIGITISTLTSKRMVRPIMDLTDGVHRVGGGDLDVDMEVSTHDEIGILTDEFNKMTDHLREKLQMQKFVSKSTIDMVKQKAKSGDIGLGGSKENFAFLFSDVRGFTAMSEKLKPEEVVGILNEYLDLQSQIIKKHRGDIDKFVGDEVMAVFSGDKKADNAISAAVEIIDEIENLNKQRQDEGKRTVDVGIGLNSGEVVHGRMGSRDRMDNTSIGDAVNLAARLCSQAEAGRIIASKIIVSSATKKRFVGKKLDPIRVKGKEKPIPIYQITGKKKSGK